MGRKERNRPVKSDRETPAEVTTASAPESLVIQPIVGNRPLLITSLILLIGWLTTLAWLAWKAKA